MFDLQVNGYGGIDFNAVELTADDVRRCCRKLATDGTACVLATIITGPADWMVERTRMLAELIQDDEEVARVIRGLHIEGPFLNPATGYVGAHPVAHVQAANIDFAAQVVQAGRGTIRLWTLAPEVDAENACTRWLSEQGIVVAAGHSDATLAQLEQAIDAGVKLFTHLGNGCPGMLPRHDNIIQRVLSLADRLWISFIADGHHVPLFVLKNYLRMIPEERVIIVSDAMAAAGLGPGKYQLAGQTVEVEPNLAAWAEGRQNYAGSATSLPRMTDILATRLKIEASQIQRWTDTNPRQLIQLS